VGSVQPTGNTGATAAARFVGGTASGAPGSGTFKLGDFVIDQTGVVWICTVAGSPGTWVADGSVAPTLTGVVTVGDIQTTAAGTGHIMRCQTNSIARTNTTAKNLFTLPTTATVVGLRIYTPTASNAGTTATISIGITGGSQTAYLNALDVKGGGVGVLASGAATNLPAPTGSGVITGIYAETGGASTLGGPFFATIEYFTV
jgi:hypothetical protein